MADVVRQFTAQFGRSVDPPEWSRAGAWIAVQGGPDHVRQKVAAAKKAREELDAVGRLA